MGEGAFRGIYAAVALVTFGVMLWIYHGLGREAPLWTPGNALWLVGSLAMWLASILLIGSFRRNPAFPGAEKPAGPPTGVFAITRHPMMWSFAIWAIVHAMVVATPKAFILDFAILTLALGGAALQDRKKAKQLGESWRGWEGRTAFFPFARGLASPGPVAAIGGTAFFFLVTWLHPIPAGFWRWIG